MDLAKAVIGFFVCLSVFIFLPRWLLPIKLFSKRSRLTTAVLLAGVFTLISVGLDVAEQWVDNHFGKPTYTLLTLGLMAVYFSAGLLYSGGKFIKKYAIGEPTIHIRKLGKGARGKLQHHKL